MPHKFTLLDRAALERRQPGPRYREERADSMPIPDYQTLMLPLLRFASDQTEHTMREAVEVLTSELQVSDEDRQELLPSGQQPVLDNRVGWARTYLGKAGLLENTKRPYFRITQRSLDVLANNPQRIDNNFLLQFSEFVAFRTRREKAATPEPDVGENAEQTPNEALEYSYQRLRQNLAEELLAKVKSASPAFFERLVVNLLVEMGYGGSRREAGRAVGRSGDGGIDGIINEDKLGLDVIYIQAKRWEGVVGRPEIHKFVGALFGQRARKGVFITTSNYTAEARQYAANLESKVVLIDGEQLSQLMIDHGIGVSVVSRYEIKQMNSDYFAEE